MMEPQSVGLPSLHHSDSCHSLLPKELRCPFARLNRQYPALAGIADQLLVAGQPTGQLTLNGLPGLLALSQLRFRNHYVNSAVGEVNPHAVTITEQADRSEEHTSEL